MWKRLIFLWLIDYDIAFKGSGQLLLDATDAFAAQLELSLLDNKIVVFLVGPAITRKNWLNSVQEFPIGNSQCKDTE
jgi:hypothetical protein